MASDASWALQQAIFAALAGDATLTGLLGGARIYDEAPQDAAFPYVTLGTSRALDWSTGTESGAEHVVTIHVWSEGGGKKEALAIMEAVRAVLDDAALTLTGHSLVNLRHVFSEARRDVDGELVHGVLRFRAVTEPAP